MSEATSRWKGPRYLAYDTYDAWLRSFFTWPTHLHPSPTALSTTGFFMLVRILSLSYIISCGVHKHFIIFAFTIDTGAKRYVFIAGWPSTIGCLGNMCGRSTGPGHHCACTFGSLKVRSSWRNVPYNAGHLHQQTNCDSMFTTANYVC